MSVLAADMTASRAVNASDVALCKADSGQPVGETNFRADVNADGNINATDICITKSTIGTGLP